MKRLSIWYIIFPLTALMIMVPMILELPPLSIPDNLNMQQIIIVIPFYLGIIAAPGYIYAWKGHYDRTKQSKLVRTWVCASLILAFLASIGGVIGILSVVAIPSITGSIICSFLLLRRYFSN